MSTFILHCGALISARQRSKTLSHSHWTSLTGSNKDSAVGALPIVTLIPGKSVKIIANSNVSTRTIGPTNKNGGNMSTLTPFRGPRSSGITRRDKPPPC